MTQGKENSGEVCRGYHDDTEETPGPGGGGGGGS